MSRCRRTSQLFLNPVEFPLDRQGNAQRSTFAQRDPADVGPVDPEFPRHPAENPGMQRGPQNLLVERGIFGHTWERSNGASICNQSLATEVYLSRTKVRPHQEEPPPPEWAGRIEAFMREIRASRQLFAARLNVSHQSVSNWLTGTKEPGAEMYYRMARLDPDAPSADYLIKKAREKSSHLASLNDLLPAHPDVHPRNVIIPDARSIPILVRRGGKAAGNISLPTDLVGGSRTLICFKVVDTAMSPIITPGAMAIADISVRDVQQLRGQLVAAASPDDTFSVRRLRRIGDVDYLSPHEPSTENHSEEVRETIGWRIVGRIILWISRA
jgi:transcriptional regulator with XRE-family HTH domain